MCVCSYHNQPPSTSAKEKRILDELFDGGTVVYGLIVRGPIGKFFNVVSLGHIKPIDKYVEETGGE